MLTLEQLTCYNDGSEIGFDTEENSSWHTPDSDGWLLIHSAAYYGYIPLLKLALDQTPSHIEDTTPTSCMTPLLLAAYMNHFEATQLLLRHHASINACDYMGRTALHLTLSGKIAQLLLQSGIDLSKVDISPIDHLAGETALQTAEREGKLEVKSVIMHYAAPASSLTNRGVAQPG